MGGKECNETLQVSKKFMGSVYSGYKIFQKPLPTIVIVDTTAHAASNKNNGTRT